MLYELRFVHGARAGQTMRLDDNQTVIMGRGTDTNCRIQDPSISRRHCQITNTPQGLLIADLGSSNGTFVNGQRIAQWVSLNPGDVVVLGQNQVEIHPGGRQQTFQGQPGQPGYGAGSFQGGMPQQGSMAGYPMQQGSPQQGQGINSSMAGYPMQQGGYPQNPSFQGQPGQGQPGAQGSMAGFPMQQGGYPQNPSFQGQPQPGQGINSSMAGYPMQPQGGQGFNSSMAGALGPGMQGSFAGPQGSFAGPQAAGYQGSMAGSFAGPQGTFGPGAGAAGQPQREFDPYMVENYVIEKKLGQGAFGAVFKAQKQDSGQVVALKTVRPQLVQNEKDIQRFFREAETGKELVHPSIIRIYEAGESRGTYFIAMEFVDGKEVAALIEQYGRIDVGYSLRVGIQIANALQHAYERSIVHRDIKPENILVTAQGQAKLVDFGLAKNFQQAGVSGLTAPGEGMGTLAYMPPEQLDNALMADQRSDIYSLGATLYHMLTGQRPFNEKTTRKFIMKILNKMPDPMTELNPAVPAELQDIVERAMSKEPEDRYQTPAELEKDLKQLFTKLAQAHAQGQG